MKDEQLCELEMLTKIKKIKKTQLTDYPIRSFVPSFIRSFIQPVSHSVVRFHSFIQTDIMSSVKDEPLCIYY